MPQPDNSNAQASIREKDVFKLSDSPERFDLVLQHMIGTAMHWEAQFPQLIEKVSLSQPSWSNNRAH